MSAAYPVREQALSILDRLCQDSLEMPLARVVTAPEQDVFAWGNVGWDFRWLHDLIEANVVA